MIIRLIDAKDMDKSVKKLTVMMSFKSSYYLFLVSATFKSFIKVLCINLELIDIAQLFL